MESELQQAQGPAALSKVRERVHKASMLYSKEPTAGSAAFGRYKSKEAASHRFACLPPGKLLERRNWRQGAAEHF